jgi:uracil-DNA glycosylase family protein
VTAQPPAGASLAGLRAAASSCTGCELCEHATQTVFSVGSASARIAFVGEQPGDVEDREGKPFVGPAGQLLDRALTEAGIVRSEAYVTNAVKHFRFSLNESGTRRIHQTPELQHITACRPWLTTELALVDPEVLVLLGATAAKSLLGPDFRVTRSRGVLLPRVGRTDEPAALQGGWMMATIHPSAVLRADDRDVAYAGFVADLRIAAAALTV